MGIFIDLKIIPQRIAPDKWKRVYQETLHLIDHYAFMDRIEAERNGLLLFFFSKDEGQRESVWNRISWMEFYWRFAHRGKYGKLCALWGYPCLSAGRADKGQRSRYPVRCPSRYG